MVLWEEKASGGNLGIVKKGGKREGSYPSLSWSIELAVCSPSAGYQAGSFSVFSLYLQCITSSRGGISGFYGFLHFIDEETEKSLDFSQIPAEDRRARVNGVCSVKLFESKDHSESSTGY